MLIKLEYVKRREVPVHVETRGVPPEGFRVGRVEVVPSTVRIKGAESRVDAVTELSSIPIDVSLLRQSIDREIPLDLARYGVQVDGEVPHLQVDVEPTSANFRIKNVDIRVLSSYKSELEEKSVTVFVRAHPRDLKALDRSQVFATVDLRGKKKGKYNEPVRVTLPENMGLVRVVPETVGVTLY